MEHKLGGCLCGANKYAVQSEPARVTICHCRFCQHETVEHPFGTIKSWMGYTHFQMKTLKHVATEMALHVLAYNIKRVINIIGMGPLIAAMKAA